MLSDRGSIGPAAKRICDFGLQSELFGVSSVARYESVPRKNLTIFIIEPYFTILSCLYFLMIDFSSCLLQFGTEN